MPKERVSITMDEGLSNAMQNYAKSKNVSRSAFIEEILAQWQKKYKRQQMIAGYKAMAKENLACAENFALLGKEIWPDE